MAAPNRAIDRTSSAAALLALLAPCAFGAAALPASDEPIDLAADIVHIDPRKDVQELLGNVRITQGDVSLQAQKAIASGMQGDHGRATFDRSVQIHTADAELKSESASATFADGQLAAAVAKGAPASFEQRNTPADKRVRGRANTIEYDFTTGTVKLTDNVWFSQGGNEFRGDTLIYYVRDERVVMNPAGKQSGRVNITIRPRNGATKAKPATSTSGSARGESGS
jgi:lipopolysaccharide transport protein LptA